MTCARVKSLFRYLLSGGFLCPDTCGQVDPEPRQLLHVGFSQTLHDDGPSGRYLFYSEFPLYLPGYFYGELSTENFGLGYGLYSIPFGPSKQWNVNVLAATALVDYVDGLEQPGNWDSSVGGGLGYTAKDRRWRILVASAYGIDAMRSDGRGGYSIATLFQFNFGQTTFASDRAFEQLRNARVPIR
jgi:hypothetical protein